MPPKNNLILFILASMRQNSKKNAVTEKPQHCISKSEHSLSQLRSALCFKNPLHSFGNILLRRTILIKVYYKIGFHKQLIIKTVNHIIRMVMTDKIADAFNFFRGIPNLLQKFACYRRSLLLLNFTGAMTGAVLGFTRLNTAVMHKTCRLNKLCQLCISSLALSQLLGQAGNLDKMLAAACISGKKKLSSHYIKQRFYS